MASSRPSFRADHVGSLLRPRRLLDVRDRAAKKDLTADQLRAVEDEAIAEIVRRQESLGLQCVTDGEFRRTYFHVDFLQRIDGVTVSSGGLAARFHRREGDVDVSPNRVSVTGRLSRPGDIQGGAFRFLKSVARATPKVSIPSPTMVHFRGGRQAIDADAYPDLDEFFADLARVYREEVEALYAAGCRYLQLDDPNLAYLCDPKLRRQVRERGDDPARLLSTYAGLINAVIDRRPEDLAVAIHLCRGNYRSAWISEGGYEPVAEVLFNELNVDAYFLEYDDERSGDFAPLRYVPKGKTVVLGLVSSKTAAIEHQRDLLERVSEATRFVPLDQLGLSPQCGFASTVHGNAITEADQWAKLELVVNTSRQVWSGVHA
jgi:5-methyltetrahydropteroyltriglutamate--homocysteine methyltransferase